ncbi:MULTISPECIES: hypothetical protein [Streptomyces]|uniref:hypothetical protein n=1 Tax=Streptomyces TaxID=1883 RepID=UPI00093A19D4|nr:MULTISPECIES: hypothetical protein [Streptomyces]MBX9424654.1 hypothetical protein [Streptomyces lateritius]OKJ57567.1 hypothetical protein AMK29_27360 [Streptomyces sp. CB02261]
MDAQMVELARVAGATVVTLMATDAWERTRDGVVALWRRVSPSRAEGVEGELEATRDDLLAARESGDDLTEQELREEWAGRLRRLLREQPEVAEELRRILAELDPEPQDLGPRTVQMHAEASGSGRVYQAGRDQHITER